MAGGTHTSVYVNPNQYQYGTIGGDAGQRTGSNGPIGGQVTQIHLPSSDEQSACNARDVAIALIAIAAIAILIAGLLGLHDVIDIGEIGSKVMIGLSATALGGLILYAIHACCCARKQTQFEHVS